MMPNLEIEDLKITAIVFDGYGTLFDLESAEPAFEKAAPNQGLEVLRWWRNRQLKYTRQCIITRRYRNLWVLMEQAMDDACQHFKLNISPALKLELCSEFFSLKTFAEVPEVLSILRQKYKLIILSHGTQEMINRVVEHNQVDNYFEAVLSVDQVQAYKPDLKAYELLTKTIQLSEKLFGYVGVNQVDIAGAKAFGMKTIWVRRATPHQSLMGWIADRSIRTLRDMIMPY